ncbi:30S ribosomal protein S20 [Lignipirellula cremea]|uniref:Small ribosomal subunit protein bS20 n=2 Tax=Lignipirellula cremea TaxID=2528010 RepID=A0A518DUU5_9BACT|nr:30S ribosomal protein S20 [Lignipirellula cremea]QDU95612.1 30S ribosomal protein S20 [Lignipirellula cremea]
MPNTKSAEKRLRQNHDRRAQNRIVRTILRNQIRRVRAAAAAGEHEQAEAECRIANKKLDQAKAKNIIHANKASRLKSRLQSMLKRAKQAA